MGKPESTASPAGPGMLFGGPDGPRRERDGVSTAPSANGRTADDGAEAELAAEQHYVTGLHKRLDHLRAGVVSRLEEALATVAHNPQSVGEREAAVQLYTERLVALDAAESGLCFGRLDRRDVDVPRYIGRIGLSSEDGAQEPPLHDLGVRRRRHIRTRGRTVVSIADETLDLSDPDVAQRSGLAGESVLLAEL